MLRSTSASGCTIVDSDNKRSIRRYKKKEPREKVKQDFFQDPDFAIRFPSLSIQSPLLLLLEDACKAKRSNSSAARIAKRPTSTTRQNHFEEWVKAGPGAEPPYEKAPPPITGT